MTNNLHFNELDIEKLDEALALVREVFLEYEAPEYSDEGIQEFMRFIEPNAIRNMLKESAIKLWTCADGDKIVGVLGACSDHINLLFVSGRYHRKGIARQLFNLLLFYDDKIVVLYLISVAYAIIYLHAALHKAGFCGKISLYP